MIYIDQVHEEQGYGRYPVIKRLRYSNSVDVKGQKECSKADMVRYVMQNPNTVRTKYFRGGRWQIGEYVHVVENNYLRTDANREKADNLGELIKY